ncbi:mitochondrial protein [Kwoniella heveanensis CBS 569]|nr:mitochondrial protein [Kwoniella heveanensis CBS 569]
MPSIVSHLAIDKQARRSARLLSSGKPYTTPAGHTPAWVPKVQWHAASAFEPSSYLSVIANQDAVVHTLGILLEDKGYKDSVRSGSILGLAKSIVGSSGLVSGGGGGSGNPLKTEKERREGYEGMNRDSALKVLETMLSTLSTPSSSSSSTSSPNPSHRSFVYISAADAFRPIVPSAYIESKREAELLINRRCEQEGSEKVKATFIRPGLMYHPHIRPLTTLPAFLIDLSSKLSTSIGVQNPFASKSPLHGAMEALRTYPLHVDHVASAVLKCIQEGREGVVDVKEMRDWAGLGKWKKEGAATIQP